MGRVWSWAQWTLAILLILPLTGCLLATLLPPPTNLPDALQYALENAGSLAESSTNPLADVEAGTVLDSLAGLDGCWATFRTIPSPTLPRHSLDVYQVLAFDAANGELVRYTYESLFGAGINVIIQTGTYSVTGTGVFRFSITKIEANKFGTIQDVTDHYDIPLVYEVRATLSGDNLKTLFDVPDDPFTPAGFADDTAYVNLRITCP